MDKSKEYLDNLRHSCAHLLAAAVMELWPDTKRTIGPAIENGFYFDFEFAKPISEADFPKIEQKMHEIVKNWKSFEKHELNIIQAKKEYPNNPYKIELIDELGKKGGKLSFYKSGDYWDLCRGGHVESSLHLAGVIKHFKLLSISGAYWRGNEKNKMLTRIYGTSFPTKEELDKYLWQIEEAKKRDHRKIAKELDLIVFSDLVGAGLPLYTPKGAILRAEVYNFSRKLNQSIGYEETALPGVNKAELFKVSGHYEKYKADMMLVTSHYSKEEFYLKPMNCPQHCVIFGNKPRSYRDLPQRYSDFSVLYRDEKPGEINGLLRSRAFTQDDGHCFCREDQIEEEFNRVFSVVDKALKAYGFQYKIRLSLSDTHTPEKYLGDREVWKRAETTLRKIVEKNEVHFFEALGEAAIYGPKLDFMVTDSLGREWQLSTIQLDMIMPGRFKLNYIDKDGSQKTPFMIHRAIIGSERFIAIAIEHYAGKFPLWLSPIQVAILTISDRQLDYAMKIKQELNASHLRVQLDEANKTIGAKIRESTLQKIPYMIIIGAEEERRSTILSDHKQLKVAEGSQYQQENMYISVRTRESKNLGKMRVNEFIQKLKSQIEKFQ